MANIFVKLIQGVHSVFGAAKVKTLVFQGRLNLDENANILINEFAPLFSKDGTQKYIFDFTAVDFVYPSMILFLLSLREILISESVELEITLTEGSPLHEYLAYCGFGDFFSIPEFPSDLSRTLVNQSDVFRMRSGSQVGAAQQVAENVVDWYKQRQPLSGKVEADTIDSIDEILKNITQHSHYTNHYLLGQAFPNSNKIRFTVYDNGLGIKAHITRCEYQEMHRRFRELIPEVVFLQMRNEPANTAIVHAAQYEVSGTDYNHNSGAGLDFLINTLSPPTNSLVSILSEDGYVKWDSGSIVENFALPFKTRGTLVSLTINCHSDAILQYQQEDTVNGGT